MLRDFERITTRCAGPLRAFHLPRILLVTLLSVAGNRASAQVPDSSLTAYAAQVASALQLTPGEGLSDVAGRLRSIQAPATYNSLHKQLASQARDAGRLEQRAGILFETGACDRPSAGVSTACRVQLTPDNARALEAAQQLPRALQRYETTRDSLLGNLERDGIRFR
jgi:hypothetical protein